MACMTLELHPLDVNGKAKMRTIGRVSDIENSIHSSLHGVSALGMMSSHGVTVGDVDQQRDRERSRGGSEEVRVRLQPAPSSGPRRAESAPRQPPKHCKYYVRDNNCRYGDKCWNIHNPDVRRERYMKMKEEEKEKKQAEKEKMRS